MYSAKLPFIRMMDLQDVMVIKKKKKQTTQKKIISLPDWKCVFTLGVYILPVLTQSVEDTLGNIPIAGKGS